MHNSVMGSYFLQGWLCSFFCMRMMPFFLLAQGPMPLEVMAQQYILNKKSRRVQQVQYVLRVVTSSRRESLCHGVTCSVPSVTSRVRFTGAARGSLRGPSDDNLQLETRMTSCQARTSIPFTLRVVQLDHFQSHQSNHKINRCLLSRGVSPKQRRIRRRGPMNHTQDVFTADGRRWLAAASGMAHGEPRAASA